MERFVRPKRRYFMRAGLCHTETPTATIDPRTPSSHAVMCREQGYEIDETKRNLYDLHRHQPVSNQYATKDFNLDCARLVFRNQRASFFLFGGRRRSWHRFEQRNGEHFSGAAL